MVFDNTYQRYKKQTDRIAQWLLETAERCGYSPESCPDENTFPKAPGGRLKGKARKEARQQEPSSLPHAPIFRLRLAQFTELARIIVKNKALIIPETFVNLVQHTIKLRRKHSILFGSSEEDSSVRDSNATHDYFVNTLKGVLDILESKDASFIQVPENSRTTEPHPKKLSLKNRFAALEVHEPTETELDELSTPPSAWQGRSKRRQIVYEAEDHDVRFAVACYFVDLHSIREFIRKTWEDYKLGKESLMTASVVTNTAFDAVRHTDDELHGAFPSLEKYRPITLWSYNKVCVLRGVDATHREAPDDLFNYEIADMANFIYVPTTQILFKWIRRFPYQVEPEASRRTRSDCRGTSSPRESGKAYSETREKLAEDEEILMETIAEIVYLGLIGLAIPGEDTMIAGLREVAGGQKPISGWLCFATQVFLDINNITGSGYRKAFQDLQITGRDAIATLENMKRIGEQRIKAQVGSRYKRPAQDTNYERTVGYIHSYVLDDDPEIREKWFMHNTVRAKHPEPHRLLVRDPLLCGLIKFSITIMLQNLGLQFAKDSLCALPTAHLYHALRLTSNLDLAWPDMDLFINNITPERLFLGGLPNDLESCLRRLMLMQGISPKVFAKGGNRRSSREGLPFTPSISKTGRDWHEASAVTKAFRDRHVMGNTVKWTFETVEAVFKQPMKNNAQQLAAREQWKESRRIGMLPLLQSVKTAIIAELPVLTFDYFGLHLRCEGFLVKLHSELKGDVKKIDGITYSNDEPGWLAGGMVLAILRNAVEWELVVKEVGVDRGLLPEWRLFLDAGALLKDYVQSDGDCETKRSEDFAEQMKEEVVDDMPVAGARRPFNPEYYREEWQMSRAEKKRSEAVLAGKQDLRHTPW